MSLTQNPLNILIRTIKVASGRFTQGPNPKPANFAKATGGSSGLTNVYGAGRSSAPMPHVDNRNWVNPNMRPFETPRRR